MRIPSASVILTRPLYLFCIFVLAVTFIMPTEGLGVELCGFLRVTGLPCFGCGLTRSLTNMTHLSLGRAWQLHPFGLVVWPSMVTMAIAGLRKSWSTALERWIRRHDRIITPIFWFLFFLFFAFGVFRMICIDSYFGLPHAHPIHH